MKILGISAFYHDSAAVLLIDGRIVAAAQEERFSRIKHDPAFPQEAIRYCLSAGNSTADDIDFVCFYDKPFLKFERLLESYLTFAPKGFLSFLDSMPIWLREKLFLKSLLGSELKKLNGVRPWKDRLLFSEHHLSHAASAFFPSPFEDALVLTIDGVGEWTTTSAAIGKGSSLTVKKEIHFPHSLGLLYSAFTAYCGFRVNSGEYKLMGLAPYGTPRYASLMKEHLVDIKTDGSFRLNMDYFDFCTGRKMVNDRFCRLFGMPIRTQESELSQKVMDLAASVQAVTEEIIIKLARSLAHEYGCKNLCLAGGVALNCVANGKLVKEKIFDGIWVQPASGDAGGALGAALAAHFLHLQAPREASSAAKADAMHGSYLGPEYSQAAIETRLKACGAVFQTETTEGMLAFSAESLEKQHALGWHQGRMEFGPRALGARSILGDPRSPQMQSTLNLRIKFRESFRPFAPAVLREDLEQWFELEKDSPYMLLVAKVRGAIASVDSSTGLDKLKHIQSKIPAVTHVDASARIQTVHEETNPLFHRLLTKFKARTGCPVLINTSFNVRGEPLVCTPEDAFRCLMGTDMESLAIGNCVLRKSEQNPALLSDYKNKFSLD